MIKTKRNIYILHKDCYELKIKYHDEYISTYFDIEDFEIVSKYKWRILNNPNNNSMYVIKHGTRNNSLHRLIMQPEKDKFVDHINQNGLDNRKQNLRVVEKYLNNRNNPLRKDNKSGVIGVYYSEANNQWRAKWYNSEHKMCQKAFSCNKYGYDEAFQMAVDYRLSMIKLNEYVYDKEMYGESSEIIESK